MSGSVLVVAGKTNIWDRKRQRRRLPLVKRILVAAAYIAKIMKRKQETLSSFGHKEDADKRFEKYSAGLWRAGI
jgi:hypothetical protein